MGFRIYLKGTDFVSFDGIVYETENEATLKANEYRKKDKTNYFGKYRVIDESTIDEQRARMLAKKKEIQSQKIELPKMEQITIEESIEESTLKDEKVKEEISAELVKTEKVETKNEKNKDVASLIQKQTSTKDKRMKENNTHPIPIEETDIDILTTKMYTFKEVADIYQVSEITIKRFVMTGKLKALKIGGKTRIPECWINLQK